MPFKPGVSGNPHGRRPGQLNNSTKVKHAIAAALPGVSEAERLVKLMLMVSDELSAVEVMRELRKLYQTRNAK